MRTSVTVAWCMLLVSAPGVAAQEAVAFVELPDSVAERLVDFYNAPGTIRLSGESLIAAGTVIAGPVAVLGGPVTIAGLVEGDVAIINGELRLEPGGAVLGLVTVVGGAVHGNTTGIAGGLSHYREPLRFRQQGGQLSYAPPVEAELSAGRDFGFGRTDVLLAVRGAYNRAEGLPISIGPRIRLGRSNPTLLEGLIIYRSSSGLRIDPDQLGYSVRVEQFLAGGRTARIGVRLHSEISPIEQWGLSDRESSLATFLLHRDYRDAYERAGWAGYVRFARPGWPHQLTFEYRDERHSNVAAASPWSLFDNDAEWRPQPAIAEGTLRSLVGSLSYDTRNEELDPFNGWHILGMVEQGLDGSLRPPGGDAQAGVGDVVPLEGQARERFTAALLDLRRYIRLGPDSRMALRILAAGSVDGTPLPPQRQQTLGGEGSLPGYSLYAFDCGARTSRIDIDGEPFFPYYGCDRLALLQLEYQSSFPFAGRLGHSIGLDLGHMMRWVVFFDAGRAWTENNARSGRLGGASDFSADAGLGLRLGQIGAYWAVPLSSGGQGLNFFVRIGRRL